MGLWLHRLAYIRYRPNGCDSEGKRSRGASFPRIWLHSGTTTPRVSVMQNVRYGTITIKDRGGGLCATRRSRGSASFSTYGKRVGGDFRFGIVRRTRHIRHPGLASWRSFRKLARSVSCAVESVSITRYLWLENRIRPMCV